MQGFAERGQIEDPDDPDFNVNLVDYFMSNVEPLEMRTKIQEFKVTTIAAAITRFQSYLRPDTISLVKNIRDCNFRDRPYYPFVPKVDTPRKASIAHDVSAAIIDKDTSSVQLLHSCDNCILSDGSPGAHMTKNFPTPPCKVCLALGRPFAHSPKRNFGEQAKKVTAITSPVPNAKGARPPWRPPKTTPYYYPRYADEYWDEYGGCLVEDQEDAITYVESDDDG